MADRVSTLHTVLSFTYQLNVQGRGAARGARGVGGFKGRGPQGTQPTMDKPKREAILDLSKYVNERIRVKFTGGREGTHLYLYTYITIGLIGFVAFTFSVNGILKGYDQLLNLVLDEVEEDIQGEVSCGIVE